MTSVRAGATWKGSGLSAAGRSAWRRAASAMAPWAVRAARARFIDRLSSVSRWAADSPAKEKLALAALAGSGAASAGLAAASAAFGSGLAAFGAGFGAALALADLVRVDGSVMASTSLSSRPQADPRPFVGRHHRIRP